MGLCGQCWVAGAAQATNRPKPLIDAYKLIAAHHGVGYQPLMRDILQRFVPEGLKEVMSHHQQEAKEAEERMDEMRKVA